MPTSLPAIIPARRQAKIRAGIPAKIRPENQLKPLTETLTETVTATETSPDTVTETVPVHRSGQRALLSSPSSSHFRPRRCSWRAAGTGPSSWPGPRSSPSGGPCLRWACCWHSRVLAFCRGALPVPGLPLAAGGCPGGPAVRADHRLPYAYRRLSAGRTGDAGPGGCRHCAPVRQAGHRFASRAAGAPPAL